MKSNIENEKRTFKKVVISFISILNEVITNIRNAKY